LQSQLPTGLLLSALVLVVNLLLMSRFFVFLGGDGRGYCQKNTVEAASDAAAIGAEVIVTSACWFVAFDWADRVRSALAASITTSSGGWGGIPLLIHRNAKYGITTL